MTDDQQTSRKTDPSTPSVARMYDYYLDGKDDFPADRAAAEQIIQLSLRSGADVREMARANRAFLVRAVREIARSGVRQFLDIGTGLPTQDNVHQVARRIAPDARVVYTDNDPAVLVHARTLLTGSSDTVIVDGDARDPKGILDAAASHLDLTRPIAVIVAAVFHFFSDDEEVARVVEALRAPLVPGSFLVISHSYIEERAVKAGRLDEAQGVYRRSASGVMTWRDRDTVRGYFDGLDLLSPGIVPVQDWRNDSYPAPGLAKGGVLGGVARVP